MLGYVLPFTHLFRLLHDTLASGELGDLVRCWCRRYMPWNPVGQWYSEQDKRGGVTVNLFSHDLDRLR